MVNHLEILLGFWGLLRIPVGDWTTAPEGSRTVEEAGLGDKRQITATCSGAFLPMQLLYQEKHIVTMPSSLFHIHHTPNKETVTLFMSKWLVQYVARVHQKKQSPDQKALYLFSKPTIQGTYYNHWKIMVCLLLFFASQHHRSPPTTRPQYQQSRKGLLKGQVQALVCKWSFPESPEWVHHSGWQCMVAVASGYKKGLVSTGWPVFLLSCTNERRKWSFHLVGAPFLAFRRLSVWRYVLWSEGLDYWMLANEWVWSGSWTCKELLKEAVDQVSRANSWQKWRYRWKKVGLI